MSISLEDALLNVWRESLIDNKSTVTLEGESFPVRSTAKRKLRIATRHISLYGRGLGGFVLSSRYMKSRDFLAYYATRFATVELDSTFYGTPSAPTVTGWYEKTPPDFLFAAKVPQLVTHQKMLADCEAEFDEFIHRMRLLNEKLGPLLFQFPRFRKYEMEPDEFSRRLRFFLNRVKNLPTCRFVVEIRNRTWLDKRFTDLLREYNVALALTDTSFMPRPWEMKEKIDLVTTDFVYVRWLGDRHGIEEITRVWDKTVVDRTEELRNWVQLFKSMVANKKIVKLFAFANNHFSGHGPATVNSFWNLWKK
jgi:uncharacterized protein YecE (DUF72 family)